MGIIKKDALRTMVLSYLGLILGYLNRGVFFILFLTSTQIGLINLIVSVGLLFAQCANLGTVYAVWKFFPFFRNKEKNNHGFLLLTSIIVSLGVLLFVCIAVLFKDAINIHYQEKSKEFVQYYYWIIPIGIGNVFFLLFDNYLRGMYKNIIGVLSNEIITRLITLFLLLLYGIHFISFEIFLTLHFIVYFIPAIILLFYLLKKNEIQFSIKSIQIPKRFKKIILAFSLYNYLNSLGALVVVTLDSLMIASYIGLKETGIYTQIIFLTSALMIPYRSIVRVGSPLVSVYWKNKDLHKMKELYQRISSVSLFIALFLFLLIWMNINDLFSFLPKEYTIGKWVFLFLMIGKMLDMYFGINGVIFLTSKKYKFDIIFTIVLIAVVYLLNLIFIPKYGIIGTAISTSISFVIYNIGRLLFVYFAYKIHPFTLKQVYLILVFVLTLFSYYLIFPLTSNPIINILFQSVYLLFTFCSTLYFFNLEPNTKEYIEGGIKFIKNKIGLK
jgi:O-antigen/teichoic acid export membrane protein